MRYLHAFGVFWWRFVIGDDRRVAAGVSVALALTALLTREGVNAWWLLPGAIALVLTLSVRRGAERG